MSSVSPERVCETESEHLDVSVLPSARGGSLDPRSRVRWVRHLAAGCRHCWLNLEGLERARSVTAGEPDIVMLALYRQPPADDLRPAHRLAVLEARAGRLGFARLVLEEARELALRDAHRAEPRLRHVLQLLAAAELETIDAPRAHDLEALGWIYLADAQRVLGQHLEAEAGFETARRALAGGSGWVEVVATFDELRSQLLRVQGCGTGALELLEKAARQLEAPGLEGRRAEVLGRRGVLLLQLGDEAGALASLEAALALLPAGQSPGLRLYLLHNCAATQARLGRVEAAAAHLDAAEPLYETHGYDFLRAQRHWVRGLVHMKARQPEPAEASLRTAIRQLLDLKFGRSAVLALFDLARLYVAAGWEHRFADMDALFEELLKRPAFRSLLRVHGRELIGLAARKGVAVPHLEELMEKLKSDSDPPSC